jgi:hypothetical protein
MPAENASRSALQRPLDDYRRLTRDGLAQMTAASVVRQFLARHLHGEIDALVARLDSLSRADFGHILGTFPRASRNTLLGWRRCETLLDVHDAGAGECER